MIYMNVTVKKKFKSLKSIMRKMNNCVLLKVED